MTERTTEDYSRDIADLNQQIDELESEGAGREALDATRDDLEAVRDFIEASKSDIDGSRGDIGETVDTLKEMSSEMEDLLNKPEIKEFVDGVKGGLESTSNIVGNVKEKLDQLDDLLERAQLVDDLTSEQASAQLEAFANAFEKVVDDLGPLIKLVPGLGAFFKLYGIGIRNIAQSAGVLEVVAARRNEIYRVDRARDLYSTSETRRADRLRDLKHKRAQLMDQAMEQATKERLARNEVDMNPDPTEVDQIVEEARRRASDTLGRMDTETYKRWASSSKALEEAESERGAARVDLESYRRDLAEAKTSLEVERNLGKRDTLEAQVGMYGSAVERGEQRLDEANRSFDRAVAEHERAYRDYQDERDAEKAAYDAKVREEIERLEPEARDGKGFGARDWKELRKWYPEYSRVGDTTTATPSAALQSSLPDPEQESESAEDLELHGAGSGTQRRKVWLGAGGVLAVLAVGIGVWVSLGDDGAVTIPSDSEEAAVTGSTTGTTGPPTTAGPQTSTFGTALQDLIDADPATFGLLQQFADLLAVFEFAWTGSAESAFDLFNLRSAGAQSNHPDGSTTGTQAGPTDVIKVIAFFIAMSQQQVDDAFNQSDFPCGEGEVATTFCTDASPDVPPGDVVMVGATLAAPVPLDAPDRSYLYFVGFEDGDPANNLTGDVSAGDYGLGTDRRYLLRYSPSGGWLFEVEGVDAPSAARFIVLDDAVLLVVPADELGASPTFRFATFENAGDGLDLTNTDDWAGNAVPNVGAQLLPIVPLEPPTVVAAGSASDPEGDAGACESALDVTGVQYLVRGRQARFLLALADDPSDLIEAGIGLDISMTHPGGERTWSIAIAPGRTTLSPDHPFRGEDPTVFIPSGPEIDMLFDSQPPPGSTLTFVTKDANDTPCDTVTFTTP